VADYAGIEVPSQQWQWNPTTLMLHNQHDGCLSIKEGTVHIEACSNQTDTQRFVYMSSTMQLKNVRQDTTGMCLQTIIGQSVQAKPCDINDGFQKWALGPSLSSKVPPKCWEGYGYIGGDVGNERNILNAKLCRDKCLMKNKCEIFMYSETYKVCYLKCAVGDTSPHCKNGATAGPVPNEDLVSGVAESCYFTE
jgi:hypothetical protein